MPPPGPVWKSPADHRRRSVSKIQPYSKLYRSTWNLESLAVGVIHILRIHRGSVHGKTIVRPQENRYPFLRSPRDLIQVVFFSDVGRVFGFFVVDPVTVHLDKPSGLLEELPPLGFISLAEVVHPVTGVRHVGIPEQPIPGRGFSFGSVSPASGKYHSYQPQRHIFTLVHPCPG